MAAANRRDVQNWWRWSLLRVELLGEPDNDALRSADIGEPVRVFVLHFANEFGPMGAHARNDSVDVIDGEHHPSDTQRVHRRVYGPKPDRVGRVEFVQLN